MCHLEPLKSVEQLPSCNQVWARFKIHASQLVLVLGQCPWSPCVHTTLRCRAAGRWSPTTAVGTPRLVGPVVLLMLTLRTLPCSPSRPRRLGIHCAQHSGLLCPISVSSLTDAPLLRPARSVPSQRCPSTFWPVRAEPVKPPPPALVTIALLFFFFPHHQPFKLCSGFPRSCR
jgi:hypothetical protein